MGDLGKLIVAKGCEKLPKGQQIAQSGHTALYIKLEIIRSILLIFSPVWAMNLFFRQILKNIFDIYFFNSPIPGLFFASFVLFNLVPIYFIVCKICRWLDSNLGSLVLKVTILPTVPQPQLPFSDFVCLRFLRWEAKISSFGRGKVASDTRAPNVIKNFE